MSLADRDLRQRTILPPQRLAQVHATVIGVGAIGRQVALQLAAIGVPKLQLIDFDIVEAVNLAPQGYREDDLGRAKVHTTAQACHELNSQIEIITEQQRFRRSQQIGDVLFCCVDQIDTRSLIWQAVGERVQFFADGRMAAEALRVLIAHDEPSRRHYPTTLFTSEQAYAGACTSRSTIYCANVAAGLMVAQFAKFLRGLPVEADVQFNLLSCELSVMPIE